MDVTTFSEEIGSAGCAVFPDALEAPFVQQLSADVDAAYNTCREIQVKNGIDVNTDGTFHHVVGCAPSFLELLEQNPVHAHMEAYFGSPYILNSFGGVINMPGKPAYVANIHRDQRSYSGTLNIMINLLLMLDDFTLENGATHFMRAGHKMPDKPEDADFYAESERITGKAGTVVLFNSNLWHAAGENSSNAVRRALTLTFTLPYIKPGMDYPRLFGYEQAERYSPRLQQVLGYNARIPSNLDEWYQPPEKRFYKPGQG